MDLYDLLIALGGYAVGILSHWRWNKRPRRKVQNTDRADSIARYQAEKNANRDS